ncbi:hypothetical protein ACSMAD_002986 [Cronobacter sakazakii]
MGNRKVGNMGRGDFDKLCGASGLIYNSSSEDDAGGWDCIVEFPLTNTIPLLNSLDEQPIQCLVQIKSTDGKKNGVSVKLSNMKRFCDTPLPCFFFFACYEGGTNITSAYLVHVDKDMMFSVMQRIRKNDAGNRSPLHKLSFTVNHSEGDEIDLSAKYALRDAIQKYIPSGIKLYCEKKLALLGEVGYKDARYALGFKMATQSDYHSLVKATLGYPSRVRIKDVQGWDTRFDIKLGMKEFTADNAIIQIQSVNASSTGLIKFEDEREDVAFTCKYYISPLALNTSNEFAMFRVNTDFFDMLVDIKNNQLHLDFESYEKPFNIPELREMLLLIKMLNSPNGSIKITLVNENGNEAHFFPSDSTFPQNKVANEIIKAEQIASALLQVASHFRVSANCKVSINELVHKQSDIERMYALINKVPGGEPALTFESEDLKDDLDCSKELRLFIAVPLVFSSFCICLAFVARGFFTRQNDALAYSTYEIDVEKLVRAGNVEELKKQCQSLSEAVNRRFENETADFYYFNSFSR